MALTEMQQLRREHDELEQRFEDHCEAERKQWDELMQEIKLTQSSVHDLAEATRNLRESTRDLVEIIEAWRSMNGVIKAGSAIGKFMRWLAGFAVIGAFITWWTNK